MIKKLLLATSFYLFFAHAMQVPREHDEQKPYNRVKLEQPATSVIGINKSVLIPWVFSTCIKTQEIDLKEVLKSCCNCEKMPYLRVYDSYFDTDEHCLAINYQDFDLEDCGFFNRFISLHSASYSLSLRSLMQCNSFKKPELSLIGVNNHISQNELNDDYYYFYHHYSAFPSKDPKKISFESALICGGTDNLYFKNTSQIIKILPDDKTIEFLPAGHEIIKYPSDCEISLYFLENHGDAPTKKYTIKKIKTLRDSSKDFKPWDVNFLCTQGDIAVALVKTKDLLLIFKAQPFANLQKLHDISWKFK